MSALVMVRYGEIALKGKNRGQFEQQLHRNLKDAVKDLSGKVERMHGRFMVSGPDSNLEHMLDRLSRVFGIVSVSPVTEVPLDINAIKQAAIGAVGKRRGNKNSFKIAARRANKNFPYESPELNRVLGECLLEAYPYLTVSLREPDFALAVEIGYSNAYIYLEQIPGPGGLPLGITGRSLLLLSGGIDSPAAGWLAMKRGLNLEALHFHSFPFTSTRSREKVIELSRKLAVYGRKIPLHMISVTEIQKELRSKCPDELGVILLRRIMLRLAERLSEKRGITSLITGENLGQVASQTLESIAVVSKATGLLILRPLIGFDKGEIIEIARKIDTYDTSILPYQDCCTVFVPKSPVTKPKIAVVERYEENLEMEKLLSDAFSTLETEVVRR
ncbi:MAG: tRNA 4-thiouridine(8) synthase ThiI [Firmicutes bacterium]|nr:tRNA 4-thiouridine(8) synthase ThiI [Bacillota bacterium]